MFAGGDFAAMSMPQAGTVQAMFAASFQASAIAKAIVDLSGRCTLVNPSFAQMLGFSPDDLVGVAFTEFTHPEDVCADVALFEALMRGERDNYQLEKRYLHRDGRVVDVLLSAAVGRAADGTPLQFIAEVIDITERKRSRVELQQANAKLHELAVDHLTGLRNRRGFEEALLGAAIGEPLSVLLVDLDNFKHVNDRLGHEAGDRVLIEAGQRLLGELRRADLLARLGGDEFAAVLPGVGRDVAERVAAEVVAKLAQPYGSSSALTRVGASVGVATCDRWNTDVRQLLARADKALYEAKGAGRKRWRGAA
jgi:diguanylate cyclase (GGDEF)-like protein/PAS domain S-box-containing protein